jgi:hypothetical protein
MSAEILKDNLHYLIIESKHFPNNPKLAIFEAFRKGDNLIKSLKHKVDRAEGRTDKSSSTAIVILIICK